MRQERHSTGVQIFRGHPKAPTSRKIVFSCNQLEIKIHIKKTQMSRTSAFSIKSGTKSG